MNEEYFIYYKNPLHRILHCISASIFNFSKKENESYTESSRDKRIAEIVERYNSDYRRLRRLAGIIAEITQSISEHEVSVAAGEPYGENICEQHHIKQLQASLRRRNDEYNRIKASLQENWNTYNSIIQEKESRARSKSRSNRFHFKMSAAASLL